MMMFKTKTTPIFIFFICTFFHISSAGLISEPVNTHSNPLTVPAVPVLTETPTCRLDLSDELFGGVEEACGTSNLDRNRCCPVLAAWLFAAHAKSALQIPALSPSPSPSLVAELPIVPDDSQKCVNSLQNSLLSRNIRILTPNASCDAVICFCGIRLHQITSLSCPAAFNVSSGFRNVTPSAAVENLEQSCRNSSFSGCSKCLGALQKIKGGGDGNNETTTKGKEKTRVSKMFNRDCQLMGLTWLLERNKTAYIPTVSAVIRAIMYSSYPPHHQVTCSPDRENMPLAVDSLQFQNSKASRPLKLGFGFFPILPLLMLGYL